MGSRPHARTAPQTHACAHGPAADPDRDYPLDDLPRPHYIQLRMHMRHGLAGMAFAPMATGHEPLPCVTNNDAIAMTRRCALQLDNGMIVIAGMRTLAAHVPP